MYMQLIHIFKVVMHHHSLHVYASFKIKNHLQYNNIKNCELYQQTQKSVPVSTMSIKKRSTMKGNEQELTNKHWDDVLMVNIVK